MLDRIYYLVRPFDRYPRGHPFGGRFRRKRSKFVFNERHARWLERIGFVRQPEPYAWHIWDLIQSMSFRLLEGADKPRETVGMRYYWYDDEGVVNA